MQLLLGLITVPLGKLYDCQNPLHILLAALAVGICSLPGYAYGDLNLVGISVILGTMIAGQVHARPRIATCSPKPRGAVPSC